tara:strand:+ start:306 stop:1019 length:714 start_codon:yes stop_codon:yes gene_type:complete
MSQQNLELTEIEIKEDTIETHNESEKKHLYNQDTKQHVKSTLIFFVEIYRVIMGSFLVLFIPQDCDGQLCSFSENISPKEDIKTLCIYVNLMTFLSLFITYIIEYYREISLIKYLEVNRFKTNDNDSIGETLLFLPERKKIKLWNIDKKYKNSAYVSLGFFLVNSVLSCITIFTHFLDSKTITVLLTNFLFIVFKIYDIYVTVNTKKNIFFSAYLKKKIQFNDVDEDYRITNTSVTE